MAELFEVIFRSFWTWSGTVVLASILADVVSRLIRFSISRTP